MKTDLACTASNVRICIVVCCIIEIGLQGEIKLKQMYVFFKNNIDWMQVQMMAQSICGCMCR